MKTLFASALIALTLLALPAFARQGEMSGRSDPSVQAHFIVASNAAYGPGEGAQVHEGWG